ncbi:UNVERIFIED_CONTAM: hypothetical protein HDU68_005536 [Siphonaria sp. JEL0065]|nr:hypothetical protein HDU68_005536 [Siphonaria sp. JEL0065]
MGIIAKGTSSFQTFRGITLQAVTWGTDLPSAHRILALHGWLDNCATWDLFLDRVFRLHPNLFYVVVIDLAGHGKSDHRHKEANYLMYNYVEDVVAVLEALDWPSFSLLGHSMGAAICCLVSSLLSKNVKSLTAIEALGPIVHPSTSFDDAEKGIAFRRRTAKQSNLSEFSSIDHVVKVRMETGLHFVSETGTRLLVERGVVETKAGVFSWSSDPVVVKNSPIRYKEEDVHSFLGRIECPVLNIYGNKGLYTWFNKKGFGDRAKHVKNLKVVHMNGSHHLHLEPDTVAAVVDSFLDFMINIILKKSKL